MYHLGPDVSALRARQDTMRLLKLYEAIFRSQVAAIANAYAGVDVLDPDWYPIFLYDYRGGMMVAARGVVIGSVAIEAVDGPSLHGETIESCAGRALEFICRRIGDFGVESGLALSIGDFAKSRGWTEAEEKRLFHATGRGLPMKGDPWRLFFNEHPELPPPPPSRKRRTR